MDKDIAKKYAEVVVTVGSNIQKGDEVVINADVASQDFVIYLTDVAYQAGAKKVTTLFHSEKVMRLRYLNETVQNLTDIPDWEAQRMDYIVDRDAAYINVVSHDPEAFFDVNTDKISARTKAVRSKLINFYEATMNSDIRWTLIAYPSAEWAQRVFPNDKDAYDKLSQLIAKAMRLDTPNPQKAWQEHQELLQSRVDYLNSANFKALRYKNSLGTDFYIELPQNYIFIGGSELSKGRVFTANMPTEEVFTAPKRTSAQGVLVASMPLVYNGSMIKDFRFTFENGKVVDFKAEQGQEILQSILDTDEGARFLGEVALVSIDSPIHKMNTLFLNTLFDENASCHFALGKAYPCIKDAQTLSKEELKESGLNDSLQHVDFMIGTADLQITGITQDGKEVCFFKNGNFDIN
jgi:aminopeptidase